MQECKNEVVFVECGLNAFSSHEALNQRWNFIIYWFAAIFYTLADITARFAGLKAAIELHKSLLSNIIRLPMMFFDRTPVGRILSRVSKDIDVVDLALHRQANAWILLVMQVIPKRSCGWGLFWLTKLVNRKANFNVHYHVAHDLTICSTKCTRKLIGLCVWKFEWVWMSLGNLQKDSTSWKQRRLQKLTVNFETSKSLIFNNVCHFQLHSTIWRGICKDLLLCNASKCRVKIPEWKHLTTRTVMR